MASPIERAVPTETPTIGRKFTTARLGLQNAWINGVARAAAPLVKLKDGASCQDVQLGGEGGPEALEVVAPGAVERQVLIYFHGGAHLVCSPQTHRELLGRLSAAFGAHVVAVNYRKAPANPFPAGLEDAVAAWHALREQRPGASIAVGGDSAGGNLAFALVTRLAQLEEQQPVAVFGMSPWLLLGAPPEGSSAQGEANGVGRRASMKRAAWDRGSAHAAALYLQGHPADDPLVSPVFAPVELVRKLPPVLIHADADEPLAAEARYMAELCERASVPVELKFYTGTIHVFQGFPTIYGESAKDSLALIGAFLERHWAPAPTETLDEFLA